MNNLFLRNFFLVLTSFYLVAVQASTQAKMNLPQQESQSSFRELPPKKMKDVVAVPTSSRLTYSNLKSNTKPKSQPTLSQSKIHPLGTELVKLSMQLYVDGKYESSPIVFIKDGQPTKLQHLEKNKRISTVVEVTPHMTEIGGGDKILLNFVVKKVIAGEEHIVSRPRVVTRFGEAAKITQLNEMEQGFELTVLPQKK